MEASRLHLSKDQTIATQKELLPQMLRFYGELAGSGPQDLEGAGQVFRFGKSRLVIQPAPEFADAQGLNLSFDTRDSISSLAAEFMRKEISVLKGPEERAVRRGMALAIRKSVWLTDPAGNTVEIGRYLYDYGPAWLGWYPSILHIIECGRSRWD